MRPGDLHASSDLETGQAGAASVQAINPFVFFVGTPRSGTTMLKRMANAHSMLAVTRETHWIPKYIEKKRGVTASGEVLPELADKLFEYHRFEQMNISRNELLAFIRAHPGLHYAELVTHIFEHYGRQNNKPLVGDKTPSYLRKIPILSELWPAARFVHLIRDGRDVCLSMQNWRMVHKAAGRFLTWQVDPVVTIALWWKANVSLGRQDGARLDASRYFELRYEPLVEEPQAHCDRLVGFLGLPIESGMVNYHDGKARNANGLSANAAWLPPTRNLRDWRTQMPRGDLEKFEAVAGDLLDALGFERGCPEVSPAVRRYVAGVRDGFTADAVARGWRLPENW